MRKNKWITVALLVLVLLMLTGCMSKEEKEHAKANEKAAKTLVNTYLKETYGKGKVKSTESLHEKGENNSPIPDFNLYTSDYVRAWVKADKSEFAVLVNVETGEFYEKRQYDALRTELGNQIVQTLDISAPDSIELFYYPTELENTLSTSDASGFAPHEVQSPDDLITSGKYTIYAVLNYINHTEDMESLTDDALAKMLGDTKATVAILNYRNPDRYVPNVFENRTFSKGTFGDDFGYYRLSDAWMFGDGETDAIHYESQTLRNIEYAWNTALVKPSFQTIESKSEVVTEYYSGATFISTDPISVEITCEGIPYTDSVYSPKSDNMIEKDLYSIRVYCFFDTDKYKEQMVVWEDKPSGMRKDVWTLDWKSKDYVYRWFSGFEEYLTVTMGYYERESE